MTKKINQHYVWRDYLRAWATDEKIYCSREKKIFNPNLKGIGQERYFYKLPRLKDGDIFYLRKVMIDTASPDLRLIFEKILTAYIASFDFLDLCNLGKDAFEEKRTELLNKYNIVPQLKEACFYIERLPYEAFTESFFDTFFSEHLNEAEENFHAGMEGDSINYMDQLRRRDGSFWENEDDYKKFFEYLSIQYYRTRNMKNRVSNNINKIKIPLPEGKEDFNIERVWGALKIMMAVQFAYRAGENRFRLVFIENNTPISFITGDQPVFNTADDGSGLSINEIQLYYPVSPTTAILLTQDERITASKITVDSENEVHGYNRAIINHSDKQIYANSKEILEFYNNV